MTQPTGPDRDEDGLAPQSDEASRDRHEGEGGTDPRPGRRTEGAGDRLARVLSEHREGTDEAGEVDEPEPYDPFAPVAEPEESEDDGDGLPDAPLFALLRTLAGEITPRRIDRVWIFPPRRIEIGETAVVVVTSFTGLEDERRRVHAAHYTALDDADEHRLAVDEFGSAPADRVGRLVEEAVERIKEGPTAAPTSRRIGGDQHRWDETLHELAEQYLEERQRDRRFRP